jgi:uridine kinase
MSRVFVIGVAGGTGSGKSTVANKLAAALPDGVGCVIEYDSYYRDLGHLPPAERAAVNFDHPDALESELLAEHIAALRRGEAIDVPVYDFVDHVRSAESRRVEPCPIVVVEGILTLSNPRIREHLDLKIFVDTDADIRVLRRIRRDIEHRGRTFHAVREQYYETVRPMHLELVEPSKRFADLIVPEGGDNHVAIGVIVARLLQAAQEAEL